MGGRHGEMIKRESSNGPPGGDNMTPSSALALTSSPNGLSEPLVRTLLVDDDPAFRRLASMALEEAGVEHESVGSAVDALRLLESGGEGSRFDLMLLDQELPGMRGEELLQLLRRNGKDIPVVLVTVHDAVSEKVRALQLGADDYLVKPFQFQELVARLRAVLRRCRGNEPIR